MSNRATAREIFLIANSATIAANSISGLDQGGPKFWRLTGQPGSNSSRADPLLPACRRPGSYLEVARVEMLSMATVSDSSLCFQPNMLVVRQSAIVFVETPHRRAIS